MTISDADAVTPRPGARVSLDELARRQGVRTLTSVDSLACDVFADDAELDEFLARIYEARRTDLG